MSQPPQSYLLRLWRQGETVPLRATLIAVAQPKAQPRHFASLAALYAFLSDLADAMAGSYTCTAGAGFEILVDASQRQGRATVVGSGDFQGACDGRPQRWTVVVAPESGKFTDAKLQTTSFGVASVPDAGTAYQIEQTVKLRGGRK